MPKKTLFVVRFYGEREKLCIVKATMTRKINNFSLNKT